MSKALPPPSPEALTPDEQEAHLTQNGEALILQHQTAGIYLMGAAMPPLGRDVSPMAFGLYVERLLDEAGNPSDPIERMLIEQIALAHHAIGRLHVEAATARTIEHAKVATTAAARLLGEFRRCTLTLNRYREPTPRPVTLVHQQNLSAGDQQVAYVERPRGVGVTKNDANTQQGRRKVEYASSSLVTVRSAALDGRTAEPCEARAPDPGGTLAVTANSVAEPAVGELDRPPDGGRQGPERAERQEAAKRRVVRPRAAAGGAGDPDVAGANGNLPAAGGVTIDQHQPDRPGIDWQPLAANRKQLIGSAPAPQAGTPAPSTPPLPEPRARKGKGSKARGETGKALLAAF